MLPQTSALPGPRERALFEGFDRMGDGEVVALLLGTGTRGRPVVSLARSLLEQSGGLAGLARSGPAQLARLGGVGPAKGLRLAAAFELARRAQLERSLDPDKIAGAAEVAELMRPRLGNLDHEEMWIVALDGQNRPRGLRRIAQGGLHGCAVSARDILRAALALAASGFVLVHNHPSGNPAPSIEDVAMTRVLFEAAELVGVALVDHVVITATGHASLLDCGLLGPG